MLAAAGEGCCPQGWEVLSVRPLPLACKLSQLPAGQHLVRPAKYSVDLRGPSTGPDSASRRAYGFSRLVRSAITSTGDLSHVSGRRAIVRQDDRVILFDPDRPADFDMDRVPACYVTINLRAVAEEIGDAYARTAPRP
jgi:hypothetical protein